MIYLNFLNFLTDKKIFLFFLAPRIIDTEKILLECLKFKKKIFVEKPISINPKFFDNIKKYHNLIFVGYNRIFYKNVVYLSKKLSLKKNLFVEVSCAENSKKEILTNSCHVVSILLKIFGHIKIINLTKNKNFIIAECNDVRKNLIILKFNFKSSQNFSIKIVDKKVIYQLKPLEILEIYNGMKIEKIDNINFYRPKLIKQVNEYKLTNYKPGVLDQTKLFKNFVNGDTKIINDISFAKNVTSICNKIYG